MKIELRKFKYAAFASQETMCFDAEVWIDGVKSGSASNDGHGGMNRVHPSALSDRLNTYGKTLPKAELGHGLGSIVQDADWLITQAAVDMLVARDLKRLLGAKLVFLKDGKILGTKKIPAPKLAMLVTDAKATAAKYQADKILNALPFEEALAVFRECS